MTRDEHIKAAEELLNEAEWTNWDGRRDVGDEAVNFARIAAAQAHALIASVMAQ